MSNQQSVHDLQSIDEATLTPIVRRALTGTP